MKDNQKKYLDRVVDLIVRDTRIDYDNEKLSFPFILPPLAFSLLFSSFFPVYLLASFPIFFPSSTFSNYCIDTYGLGEEEIDYVWNQYRDTIKDKLTTK